MTKKKEKARESESDEDDMFFYRYCGSSSSNATQTQHQHKINDTKNTTTTTNNNGSGPLAPSKSTVYVSNLDYSLTNSDIHTLFSTFGRIARVTVLKDRHTRLSRGVAFVQFVSRDDARSAAAQMHRKILNGRTLTASIAADNGRAPEFIRKRVYRDDGRCFECGDSGHLSYDCPRNLLGPRERPPPPKCGGRRGFGLCRGKEDEEEDDKEDDGSDGGGRDRFEDDNWASVVDNGADERLLGMNENVVANKKKKKEKKAGYFSDESDDDDD
ncbi:U11/U12 small nuclear ribonucleoprotein 31 kDa protein [Gastrolobium bilobum]|uniref:U11/U12 small nuclear ribonucleoprotein 31 kDa protein n=1 Tax=Gastrolobium bilobum TaxID=150636 RepID=UPI002AB2F94A|nr:U11/U12 small nuclear ribonucleoprotein 31 kDa protein [Gastrolobium bilobum]XP_061353099.1 U11/U12 small nuclear ribonucleoprotein 31 kDa protein [Gastrolobium bilobum]